MKAAVLNKKNEDLEIKEVPMPEIDEDDVLVKVKYAGVNPLDNMIVREEVKLITPYKYPLVMGNEFSGIVEKTGSSVTDFTEGDRVYARMPLNKIGAFAEYVAINKDAIAGGISFGISLTITPLDFSLSGRFAILYDAPLTLNEPVTCKFSVLR